MPLSWKVRNLLYEGQIFKNKRELSETLKEEYSQRDIKILMLKLEQYISYKKFPNSNKIEIIEIYTSPHISNNKSDKKSIEILSNNETIDPDAQVTAGVYGIYNSITKMWYIGRSKDIESRWNNHNTTLVQGRHHNTKLQDDYNTYGPEAFHKFILYTQPANEIPRDLSIIESSLIKIFDSKENGYNIQS